MPGKSYAPSSSDSGSDFRNEDWITSNAYNLERFFPHMFRMMLQQLRLQRAIISYLAAKDDVETYSGTSFDVVLKDSIIKEKEGLLKMLDKHLSHLQNVGAPDVINAVKKTQMIAVEGSIVELERVEPKEILKSTLEDLSNSILVEYLDLVTDFVGEDSNWPIGQYGDGDERLVNKMLRF